MDPLWGILMISAGFVLFICGLTSSDFIVCKLLRARSKILFGEKGANVLHLISGLIIMILGALATLGYIW